MKIGIIAPSPVPFAIGGAEGLWWGLLDHLNQETVHQAELIKLPSPESDAWEILSSYRSFALLDLSHFDLVISTKYPAWMVDHPRHVVFMQHRLRGLYDTYHLTRLPEIASTRDPELLSLQEFVHQHAGLRESLPEFFERVDHLARRRDELRGEFGLPGPLIRTLVHYLDGIGLSPNAIARWAAISKNVASRPQYFPYGVRPMVIHHPSHLRHFRDSGEDHLFTIARLDSAKRIDLLIRAMRHVKAPVPLRIAGTGPEEDDLRQLAAGDPRIELLGFVTDREAERLYAGALVVPYVPYEEDYGLVTIEAMSCGKPVITTTDAGGPNEFVDPGVTGLRVDPDPALLGDAIDSLCADSARARSMGQAARRRVQQISWSHVVRGLLGDSSIAAAGRGTTKMTRKRLAVATTFPIHPPEHGGQVRLFELLKRVAVEFDVDVVSLGRPGDRPRRTEVAPGLTEVCIPPSDAHLRAEMAISRDLGWLPVTDVAFPALFEMTPRWLEALARAVERADGIIVSHPFPLPAVESLSPDVPLFYDAQDVELDLKSMALRGSQVGQRILEEIRNVEERCCLASTLVFACSAENGTRFEEAYGLPPDRLVVIPNGVDVDSIDFVGPEQREARKKEIGLPGVPTGLFIGSWHPPNIDAVRNLSSIAERRPEMRFLVLGGVGGAFAREPLARNLGLLGFVDGETKELVSCISDVALNPMSWGSGTNLKMLEYCAAGIPVLTTEFGLRGLSLRTGDHVWGARLEDFPEVLLEMSHRSLELRTRSEAARQLVERHYDWDVIAERMSSALKKTISTSSTAFTDMR